MHIVLNTTIDILQVNKIEISVSCTSHEEVCQVPPLNFMLNSTIAVCFVKPHQSRQVVRLFIRESAILPFELTLQVSHLIDADGTPILQAGFFNQGVCAGLCQTVDSYISRFIFVRADLLDASLLALC